MRYAQINDSLVCIAIASVPTEIVSDNMVPIDADDDVIGCRYVDGVWLDASGPITSLSREKASAKIAVDQIVNDILIAGAPYPFDGAVLHIELTDGARADMGAMATTSVAALSGGVPWPASYQGGWISAENIRIPLATPADGLALAAGVGDYYAKVRQRGRTLKDAILTSETVAAVEAIDIHSGWPT